MANRYWCTRCNAQMLHRMNGGLCFACVQRDRTDRELFKNFRPEDTEPMFLTVPAPTPMTGASNVESLEQLAARLRADPMPPLIHDDLHVTPALFEQIKRECRMPGELTDVLLNGVEVIPDLPEGTVPPYRLEPRPTPITTFERTLPHEDV